MTEKNLNDVDEVIVEVIDNVADAVIELVDIASNFAKLFVRTRSNTIQNVTNVVNTTTDYVDELRERVKESAVKTSNVADVAYSTWDELLKKISETETVQSKVEDWSLKAPKFGAWVDDPAPGGLSSEKALQKIEEWQTTLINGGKLTSSQKVALESLLEWSKRNGY